MPDSLEEEAGVSFFGGQEWAPQQTSPAHPSDGTPASLGTEEGEQTSSAWGAGAEGLLPFGPSKLDLGEESGHKTLTPL